MDTSAVYCSTLHTGSIKGVQGIDVSAVYCSSLHTGSIKGAEGGHLCCIL